VERLNCNACGGALQKLGAIDYKCLYCGALHQIEIEDAEAVKDLVEENSRRWMKINRLMDSFFPTVNEASIVKFNLKKPRLNMIVGSLVCLFILVGVGVAFYDFRENSDRPLVLKDLAPFAAVIGFALVINLYSYILILLGRRRMNRMLGQAESMLNEVVDTYQQMLDKPAKEIIDRLHNPNKLMDYEATTMAYAIYNKVIHEDYFHNPPPLRKL